jgi:TolA-binding protein
MTAKRENLNKTNGKLKKIWAVMALAAALGLPTSAFANLIDSITLSDGGEVVIVNINMTTQVHYLRHIPTTQGRTLRIFFDVLPGAGTDDLFELNEQRNSPATRTIPSFIVNSNRVNNQNELAITFSSDAEFVVLPGRGNRSFQLRITKRPQAGEEIVTSEPEPMDRSQDVPAIASLTAAEISSLSPDEVQARELMLAGREGLTSGDFPAAVGAFNKVLSLPPNRYTQDAQEWIGVARERAGQNFRAKVEYETYLKTYPESANTERIKGRLARLAAQATQERSATAEKRPAQTMVFGGVSSFYNHSVSDIKTPTSSNSVKDLSSLFSSLDFSVRHRGDVFDNRFVFRGSYTNNFLPGDNNNSRLSAAYVDIKNNVSNYTARVGRQSPTGDGIMGRFDGAVGSYGVSPKWQVGLMAGQIAEPIADEKPVFMGGKVGYTGGEDSPWSGSVYFINQTAASLNDRRAIGMETRYFDLNKVGFLLLDYDTTFNVLNTALMQGSMTMPSGAVYHFLLDHRKNVSISNALMGASTTSLRALANDGLSESVLRQLALDRTMTTDLAQAGFTTPFNEKWQVGVDVSLSSNSGMSASGRGIGGLEGDLAETPAIRNAWNFSAQLIGNGVLFDGDITLFGLTHDTVSNSIGAYVTNHVVVDKWILDTSLRALHSSSDDSNQMQYLPSFKAAYQMKDSLNFEAEFGWDRTSLTATAAAAAGAAIDTLTNRKYFTLGFRWMF